MENTRIERETRVKRNSIKSGSKNYRSRYGSREAEENDYKKSLFTLRIVICIGILTSALLIKEINNPFTNNITAKIKIALSENTSISEIYNKVSEKISDLSFFKDNSEDNEETTSDNQENTKKKSTSKKLVPTLE